MIYFAIRCVTQECNMADVRRLRTNLEGSSNGLIEPPSLRFSGATE